MKQIGVVRQIGMRGALRAYALESDNPAEVLGKLDRKMRYFEAGALATVLYAVIDHTPGQHQHILGRAPAAGHRHRWLARPTRRRRARP